MNKPTMKWSACLWRLVRLLFSDPYKRGYAAGLAVSQWRAERKISELSQHLECTEGCYRLNLTELREVTARMEKAEARLKECRRHLRAANKGAERNAIVAQLCAARQVIRSGLPNNEVCQDRKGEAL